MRMIKRMPSAAGHNADDIAETVLLNILRGDVPRLGRCASIITGASASLSRLAESQEHQQIRAERLGGLETVSTPRRSSCSRLRFF